MVSRFNTPSALVTYLSPESAVTQQIELTMQVKI
jgi:hypothetical protein